MNSKFKPKFKLCFYENFSNATREIQIVNNRQNQNFQVKGWSEVTEAFFLSIDSIYRLYGVRFAIFFQTPKVLPLNLILFIYVCIKVSENPFKFDFEIRKKIQIEYDEQKISLFFFIFSNRAREKYELPSNELKE
jgi:hypothetical protein